MSEGDQKKALDDLRDPGKRPADEAVCRDRRRFIKAALLAAPVVLLLTTRTTRAQGGSEPTSGQPSGQ